jgi:hypothetical protein
MEVQWRLPFNILVDSLLCPKQTFTRIYHLNLVHIAFSMYDKYEKLNILTEIRLCEMLRLKTLDNSVISFT